MSENNFVKVHTAINVLVNDMLSKNVIVEQISICLIQNGLMLAYMKGLDEENLNEVIERIKIRAKEDADKTLAAMENMQ